MHAFAGGRPYIRRQSCYGYFRLEQIYCSRRTERLPNGAATLTLTLALFAWNGKQISVLLVAVRYGSLPRRITKIFTSGVTRMGDTRGGK